MKRYTIFAGINGAGKSTLYHGFYKPSLEEKRINTDEMVARLAAVSRFSMVCMAALLVNGCLTFTLLDKVDPCEKVIISCNDTTEEELQQKNLSYIKRDNYFVVEKTPWQKTGDYTVLAIGLPFTAAADTALAACFVMIIWNYDAHRHDDDDWNSHRHKHHHKHH